MKSAGLLLVSTIACAPEAPLPEGHVLVSLTTDAPLPAPPGAPAPDRTPLFDRLRIEIFPPGAAEPCAGCSREIAVDDEIMAPASFTITGTTELRLRVRLYRSGGTASGEPRPASTIETIARISQIPDEGGLEQHLVLRTEDVGLVQGSLEDPVDLAPGRAPGDRVGTFAGAEPKACSGAAPPGAVCVPGGAFWMGNPRLDLGAAPELDGALEHLVVLSPFWLDAEEVSVERFRASGLAVSLVPGAPSDNPHEAGTGIEHCTYTSAPSANDALPVNCITWALARAYCEAAGLRLPTEAELERAGSALGSSAYVWGADAPACEDAVFDRDDLADPCAPLGVGAAPVGSGLRDRLALSGAEREVVDLAGNVREWALDRWNREDEPCWSGGLRPRQLGVRLGRGRADL